MFTGFASGCFWYGSAFIAVKYKRFIYFGEPRKKDRAVFGQVLHSHKYLMPHIEGSLVGKPVFSSRAVQGAATKGVTYKVRPYRLAVVGIGH